MIVLDTHAWIWLLSDPSQLSKKALETVDDHEGAGQILISAMSVWELFFLVKKRRLALTVPPAAFLTATHGNRQMKIATVDDTIARRSVELPDIHSDPADRLILSTAAELGCPIVSRDQRLSEYDLVPIIW